MHFKWHFTLFVVPSSLWPVQWCTLLTFGEAQSKVGPAQVKTSG